MARVLDTLTEAGYYNVRARHWSVQRVGHIEVGMAREPKLESGMRRRGSRRSPDPPQLAAARSYSAAKEERDEALSLLVRHFVTSISALPQARAVLIEDTEEGPRLWTVIEAEPFERDQREPIYQAEGEALRRYPSVDASFRLVNASEFGADRLESMLSSECRTLWRRSG